MYWANFLHLYQPPVQERWIVEKVADECYRKLVRILRENPGGRLTLNINGSLTEQFYHYGMHDILDGLRELAEEGRIEFTGSAMYHPILPLIPEEEVRRQIRLNQEVNREYLGEAFQPRGFFPPEMCYNRRVAEIVKEEGFSWIITDEISYNGRLARIAPGRVYTVKGLGEFGIFFKERKYSAALTYGKYRSLEEFLADLDPGYRGEETYLLTGTDGEITVTIIPASKTFWPSLPASGDQNLYHLRVAGVLPPGRSGDRRRLLEHLGDELSRILIPSGIFPATKSMNCSGA